MSSNISLYIKRAESFHTKEFITEAFASNKIGIVKDVQFIKKCSDLGKEYNGAIVTFETWFMNSNVTQLLNQMGSSVDGTTKFTYDGYNRRYWFINVYKTPTTDLEVELNKTINIEPTLSDKERIKELEKLVMSMSVQIHYMQTNEEKYERQLMDYEEKHTYDCFYNMELKSQINEKEWEKEWEKEELQKQIEILKKQNDQLTCRLVGLSIDGVKKEKEIETLKQELYDEQCIMSYVEEQANEMREMIHNSYQENRKKNCVEELID